jgi:hypothetical protein
MNREQWLCYMLGFMVSAGWTIPQEDVEDFKLAFPEIPEHLVNLSIERHERKAS